MVGLCWPSMVIVGLRWPDEYYIVYFVSVNKQKQNRPNVGLRGCRGPVLACVAFVGLGSLSWAGAGLRGPSWACVGLLGLVWYW